MVYKEVIRQVFFANFPASEWQAEGAHSERFQSIKRPEPPDTQLWEI